jgi:hypothetical protein
VLRNEAVVGCKSDKSPAYGLTASEAIDTRLDQKSIRRKLAWVSGRSTARAPGPDLARSNSMPGTERLGAEAGRGARNPVRAS